MKRKMMNASPTEKIEVPEKRRHHPAARMIIPLLVVFLAGAALSAVWFSRGSWWPVASPVSDAAAVQLSDATKAILQHLESPVEIRFYSMLDTSSVPDSVQAYAGRVEQLLGRYEQAADHRVRIARYNFLSASNAHAAQADGIRAFNIDKGDSCFLGIAVVCDQQKESLSYLAPEWEQALEPDLSRAISRAAEARQKAQPVAPADTATLEAVRRSIPNLDAVSLEAGTEILRASALAQFKQAAQELDARLKDVHQRLSQGQDPQSDAARQAAREQLQKVQAEGADKLQQIALNSHAQIVALQQLKKSSP
jgi:ABC-type uncharacterized transport system involved in gliding motility auxiliary subunit